MMAITIPRILVLMRLSQTLEKVLVADTEDATVTKLVNFY